jgi:DNA-binding MarR family transcriptional regulator
MPNAPESTQPNREHYIWMGTVCTCSNLRKAARVITKLYDEILQPSGLTATQALLLTAIAANGAVAITPLAEQLAMDRTTLARNLQLLAREGWVAISTGEDRRTRQVSLTVLGKSTLDQALPLWDEAQREVIARLGEDRWRAMLGDWADLVASIREQ